MNEENDLSAAEKRKIEVEAKAIEQKVWFIRGWTAGEKSLARALSRSKHLPQNYVKKIIDGLSLSDAAANRDILADIVKLIGKLKPHVREKRRRGRPRRPEAISGRDLFVLADAISRGSIKAAVTAFYNAGYLPHTTTIDAHVKRLNRRINAGIAALNESSDKISDK